MNKALYNDCLEIVNNSIKEVQPAKAIQKTLKNFNMPKGNVYLIAIGKAAYTMAKETIKHIKIKKGIVITKYGHSKEKLTNIDIYEAGHPILDKNSIDATEKAISLTKELRENDAVIFLVSGGGSSLFESPRISLEELQDINDQLIKSGASIQEINTIRKKLSKVKGGRFAEMCSPAKVFNIIISDVVDNSIDMIASGPTVADMPVLNAATIIKKYNIKISDNTRKYINSTCVQRLNNVETYIPLDNESLKLAAEKACEKLGYMTNYVYLPLICDINDAEKILLGYINNIKPNNAIILGGEVVLNVKGQGLGGRNQELALRAGRYIKDKNTAIVCVGSDGNDGPTDAAGAYVDKSIINNEVNSYLENNDSYNYHKKNKSLIITGPTGTNVCDLYIIIRK